MNAGKLCLEAGRSRPMRHNEIMAVREGFEPSVRFRTHTFQACAFDHSATSPAARSLTEFRRYRKPEKGRDEVDIYK